MTEELEGGEWSAARPGRTLPPGKTRYPFYRRLGGSQGRSGRAENLVPTGIRSRTVQTVVSRYTDWATRPNWVKIYLKNVPDKRANYYYYSVDRQQNQQGCISIRSILIVTLSCLLYGHGNTRHLALHKMADGQADMETQSNAHLNTWLSIPLPMYQ